MAFKVGDRVIISYEWMDDANDSMLKDKVARDRFAGWMVTIDSVESGLNGDVYFSNSCVDSLGHVYGWFEEQLELVVEEEEMKYKNEECKYFDGLGHCLGTKELDPCTDACCPFSKNEKKNECLLKGVDPDAPVVVNEKGGKQSDSPYAFHMIPVSSILAAAEVCAYGAKKYGETIGDRNYTKIPAEEHINHAIAHMYAYLAGDRTDDHLGHAIVRTMFAYDTAQKGRCV